MYQYIISGLFSLIFSIAVSTPLGCILLFFIELPSCCLFNRLIICVVDEPACFGADVSKTRDKCAASICALKPEKKSC